MSLPGRIKRGAKKLKSTGMEIIQVKLRPELEKNKKWLARYTEFVQLMDELRKRELPPDLVSTMNQGIAFLNSFQGSDKELRKQVRAQETRILKLIEKELKLVTKNSYRTRWMVIGMSAFGIPFGWLLEQLWGTWHSWPLAFPLE